MTVRSASARIGFALVFILASASCKTWVELTPEGEQVRLASAEEVASCDRVGRTRTRTSAKAWIFPRSEDRVSEELSNMARIDAAEMGGTDIAPIGDAEPGRQEFGIYRCPGVAPE